MFSHFRALHCVVNSAYLLQLRKATTQSLKLSGDKSRSQVKLLVEVLHARGNFLAHFVFLIVASYTGAIGSVDRLIRRKREYLPIMETGSSVKAGCRQRGLYLKVWIEEDPDCIVGGKWTTPWLFKYGSSGGNSSHCMDFRYYVHG